ncbi:CHAT domain-containing protein [Ustulina deusta]|nr:CHAT domain-containing protein [Ustulina deusta]
MATFRRCLEQQQQSTSYLWRVLEIDEENDSVDFYVGVSESGNYELEDASGQRIPNLPRIHVAEDDSAVKVIRIIRHIRQFRIVQRLGPDRVTSLKVPWTFKLEGKSAVPPNEPELDKLGKKYSAALVFPSGLEPCVPENGRAIAVTHQAVETLTPDHPDRGAVLENLANDLNLAIDATSMALDASVLPTTRKAIQMHNFAALLGSRFDMTASVDDLNRSIEAETDALKAIAPDNTAVRCKVLEVLFHQLKKRFKLSETMENMQHTINVLQERVDATPPDHSGRITLLGELKEWVGSRRFSWTGLKDDLDLALKTSNAIVHATPKDHPDWGKHTTNLSHWLLRYYDHTGSVDHLNQAIGAATTAIAVFSQHDANRLYSLQKPAVCLLSRAELAGSMRDFDEAVETARTVTEATPHGHPNRGNRLGNLSNALGRRFEQTGSRVDLDQAVEAATLAVDATQDVETRATQLSYLGIWLSTRFKETGSMDDLKSVVESSTAARAVLLNNLSNCYGIRAQGTASTDDLNRAIAAVTTAIEETPSDNTDRAIFQGTLGVWLNERYELTRSIDDLNRAVDATYWAVKYTPPGHYFWTYQLLIRGNRLQSRYKHSGSLDDLNEAIDVLGPHRVDVIASLGNCVGRRFMHTESPEDITRAIELISQAVDFRSRDHDNWAFHMGSLSHWFGIRYSHAKPAGDLDTAIENLQKALAVTPKNRSYRAGMLAHLGSRYFLRYEHAGSQGDLASSISSFRDAWLHPGCTPLTRSEWEESYAVLREAVRLLPLIAPRALRHSEKESVLIEFTGLASAAAAAALQTGEEPYRVLQLLEAGRGIISNSLNDMREDLSELQRRRPDLADDFVRLRDELGQPDLDAPPMLTPVDHGVWEARAKIRREADGKFTDLISNIRAIPEFHNFLLPLPEEEIMLAAEFGPIVVVNIHASRSDAFIIERDQIREIEKQTSGPHISQLSASGMATRLEWLWDSCCSPILEALGFTETPSGNDWPHVWWIPTGPLTQEPLHAAGYHSRKASRSVLERALLRARRRASYRHDEHQANQALLIAMQETPGLSASGFLPFVADEVKVLHDFSQSSRLRLLTPAPLRKEVLQSLECSTIFHFAGHGKVDPTRPLTVKVLMDQWLSKGGPFLGYLSACSSGANHQDLLLDEGLHLINSFQLAGCRHVIGTLWQVSDKHCVDLARILYETLLGEGMTDEAVSRGLHRAMRTLRDNGTKTGQKDRHATLHSFDRIEHVPHYWVPYVHFGC